MPSNVDELLRAIQDGAAVKFLFFWGHTARGDRLGKECLSQWYPAPFRHEGVEYPTAEHWMMAEKARLFGDEASARKIVSVRHPGEAKKLGRAVIGFDTAVWDASKFDVVVQGNLLKFSQGQALGRFLLNTQERVLVEASPVDRIWGIGLAADDENATNVHAWRGENLLGFALMEVRRRLRAAAR